MGSGSEVSKQAAKIVLTDDNFATLVSAVDLGRDIYRRITTYVKLQLTVLSSVLQLMVLATILDINDGVALFPMQLLFCKFFVVVTVVVGLIVDVPDPSVMQRPPREPGTRIVTRPQVIRWLISGFVVAGLALAVLHWGPDTPSTEHPSVSMTMAFAIVALSAVNLGVVLRREREAPWSSPVFPYFGWIILGWILTWAAVELNMLQRLLDTESMTGGQWVVVLALSLVAPAVVGIDKVIQLARQNKAPRPGLVGRSEQVAKNKKKQAKKGGKSGRGPEPTSPVDSPTAASDIPDAPVEMPAKMRAKVPVKMKAKEYERELRTLHGELVAMQEWVKTSGAKVCVVFEGRDTAGKGGTIKAITERVSPRVFRVVALPAPTEREQSQMYVQRYIPHFPAAREVVIFDRSWYNRAGVERVMGFCTEQQTRRGRVTRCSGRPTLHGHPGTWRIRTTRGVRASTSSPICSARCPTRHQPGRRSSCRSARSATTPGNRARTSGTSRRRTERPEDCHRRSTRGGLPALPGWFATNDMLRHGYL